MERLKNAEGSPTRLVYYVGGKLDFSLIDVCHERSGYDRPFKILLDKDNKAAGFRSIAPQGSLPDQKGFDECVNWGCAAAIMIAKAIVRDEPWSVKIRDNDMKAALLRMIEWDHRVRHGVDCDLRYLGTGIRAWMDSGVQQRLEACWAHFDLTDSRRALWASVDLFRDLASRIATMAGLTDFDHDAVRSEIDRILKTSANI